MNIISDKKRYAEYNEKSEDGAGIGLVYNEKRGNFWTFFGAEVGQIAGNILRKFGVIGNVFKKNQPF